MKPERFVQLKLYYRSNSETAIVVRELLAEIERLQEFIRYWSYCTRQGVVKYCPEKRGEWTEAMRELCPEGVVELAAAILAGGPPEERTDDDSTN